MELNILAQLVDKGILTAILFYLFINERRERIHTQRKLEECFEETANRQNLQSKID